MKATLGIPVAHSGDLTAWAKQGVLLLNTVLTVRAHEANSHRGQGWETFTDAVITSLNQSDHPIVFVLWGKPAQSKEKLITNPNHLILKAPHPSPLSSYRGFFGSKPFSQINDFLRKNRSNGQSLARRVVKLFHLLYFFAFSMKFVVR